MRIFKLKPLCLSLLIVAGLWLPPVFSEELPSQTLSTAKADDFKDEDTAEAADEMSMTDETMISLSSSTTVIEAAAPSEKDISVTIDGQDDPTTNQPDIIDDTTVQSDTKIANYNTIGTVPTEAVYEAPQQSPAWSGAQNTSSLRQDAKKSAQPEIDRSPDLYITDQNGSPTTAESHLVDAEKMQTIHTEQAPATLNTAKSTEIPEDSKEPGFFKRMVNWIGDLFG